MAAAAAKGKCGGLGQLLRKLERWTASAMLHTCAVQVAAPDGTTGQGKF